MGFILLVLPYYLGKKDAVSSTEITATYVKCAQLMEGKNNNIKKKKKNKNKNKNKNKKKKKKKKKKNRNNNSKNLFSPFSPPFPFLSPLPFPS